MQHVSDLFSGEPEDRNAGQAVQHCQTGDQHQQSQRVRRLGEACIHVIIRKLSPQWKALKTKHLGSSDYFLLRKVLLNQKE